jgi:(p)ppGpp synthase/HD superfamily hydrolase
MIYTDKTKKAMKLCFEAHKDQVDKSGMPYVFHPFHVAEQMTDEVTTIVALLHDVVEDTDYTLDNIAAMGFGQDVMDALALMTHDKSAPYLDYVARLKSNRIAREVKLADLKHNSDVSRLPRVSRTDMERLGKYKKAIALLEGGGDDV